MVSFDPVTIVEIKNTIRELIRSGLSRADIIRGLATKYSVEPVEIGYVLAEVVQELKVDLLFDRTNQQAETVYWYFNQLIEVNKDLKLIDVAIEGFVNKSKDGKSTTINKDDADNVGKLIERKTRVRNTLLAVRDKINNLLRLNIDSDVLKAIQTLMTVDTLPDSLKNKLFMLTTDYQESLLQLSTLDAETKVENIDF